MTETDIQRYAREIAAVDLTTFDLSHPTTTEYRLAHEVVRLREENDRLHQQYLTGCLEDRATIQQLRDANDRLLEELAKPLTHEAIMKRVADDVGRVIANALDDQRSPFMHRERKPGSPEAIANGCNCAADDNAHGQGVILKYSPPGQPTRAWWIAPDCPLHALPS